ncbi:hypothetical protein [Labedaea rhizosphaerae]|uniref:Uncharacterized protein n=1 Tax=Labedaea rhizosphaerae TaxID=598644 RepID=A0A4R6RQK0_LABRH|nr:hypothetical protein [Labedaea rhizosphaerae]TDP89063.1 hypothetical protein EV186_11510 [Labedaea rhizosphaerae]
MSSPIVLGEIGGHDTAKLREFYGKALGRTMRDADPEGTMVGLLRRIQA